MTGMQQVLETGNGPNLLVRALWYLLVGWWLTAVAPEHPIEPLPTD